MQTHTLFWQFTRRSGHIEQTRSLTTFKFEASARDLCSRFSLRATLQIPPITPACRPGLYSPGSCPCLTWKSLPGTGVSSDSTISTFDTTWAKDRVANPWNYGSGDFGIRVAFIASRQTKGAHVEDLHDREHPPLPIGPRGQADRAMGR